MTAFKFPAWYVRMGYARHGGQKACAELLGLTDRHVRYLVKEGGTPSPSLAKLCQVIEDPSLLRQWLAEAREVEGGA